MLPRHQPGRLRVSRAGKRQGTPSCAAPTHSETMLQGWVSGPLSAPHRMPVAFRAAARAALRSCAIHGLPDDDDDAEPMVGAAAGVPSASSRSSSSSSSSSAPSGAGVGIAPSRVSAAKAAREASLEFYPGRSEAEADALERAIVQVA